MKKLLDEDAIMITCSPVQKLNGAEYVLVNISMCGDEISKYCGIQLPQLFISYNRGFSDEEMAELTTLVEHEKTSLWCKAQDTKPYSDYTENYRIV